MSLGGADYYVVKRSDYSGDPDGFSDHLVGSGDYVLIIDASKGLDITQCGAKAGGIVGTSEAIQKAVYKARDLNVRLTAPARKFKVDETIIIPEGTWLEGELHFFRGNNDATEFTTDKNVTILQLQNYSLGHKISNLRLTYTGPLADMSVPGFATQDGTVTTTSGMGSEFYNIYVKGFDVGFYIQGWVWQQYFFNCFSEKHKTSAFLVRETLSSQGGPQTSAALIHFDHCTALNGNIPTNGVGFDIRSGNVRMENPRFENNTIGVVVGSNEVEEDASFATVSLTNGYFEGNRNRDIQLKDGGNFIADYCQFFHQNSGVTTFSCISAIGEVGDGASCIIDKAVLKANSGNNISYLVVDEVGADIEIRDLTILDLQNEMDISPQFNGRYAPRLIGMSKHGFDVKRRSGKDYYIQALVHTDLDSFRPTLNLDSITYELNKAQYYTMYAANSKHLRKFIPGIDAGQGYWFYIDSDARDVYYNNTAEVNNKTFDPRLTGGVLAVNFGTGGYTITVTDSLMEIGDKFTVTDAKTSGAGSGAQATVNFESGPSFTVASADSATFKKIKQVGAEQSTKIIRV